MKITQIKTFLMQAGSPSDRAWASDGKGHQTGSRNWLFVKVYTDEGIYGVGECSGWPRVIEAAVRDLAEILVGEDPTHIEKLWQKMMVAQMAHGVTGVVGAGAMSGIDMALWDLRGKALGLPLFKLLGGSRKPIPAYAGGVSLGYQPPDQLIDEAKKSIDHGYKAVKLRLGDSPKHDIQRVMAIRKAFGEDLVILTDANIGCSVEDVRQLMPALDELNVGWLEEPFPAHDYRSYREAKGFGRTPLAAGENHYTRFEFDRVIEDGAITILQPDLSKSGGLTECLRIASMASAWKLPIHPHSSMTGLNHAASIHFLAAIDNGGYFEGDVSKSNRYRDDLVDNPGKIDKDGNVWPLEKPGLGLEVNEEFLAKHPPIEGPGYV